MRVKIDLHVHTNHSRCSNLKPAEIEAAGLRKGLDCIAITDHNTINGALEVAASAKSLRIIIGEEIRTSRGEIIGYFLKEHVPAGLSPDETIAEIKRQGGLVSVPHPFDRLRSSRLQRDALEQLIGRIDMLEVFNSRDIMTVKDDKLILRLIEKGAVPVVSSDAHLKTEIGRAVSIIDDFSSPAEFLQNLKSAQWVIKKSPFWVHIATKIIRNYKKWAGANPPIQE